MFGVWFWDLGFGSSVLGAQGYLAHKHTPPHTTIPVAYA